MSLEAQSIFSLKEKEIWVFGGAGYLGQAIVKLLVQLGATVLCVDLENKSQLFVDEQGFGDKVIPATLNVTDTDGTSIFIAEQVSRRGVPHGCVSLTNASISKKLEELTSSDFDNINHGSITSVFFLVREIGTAMAKEGRGSIVLFSSMYGMVSPDPDVYQAPMNKNPIEYGVGKAGMLQMCRYLAVHWGKMNVRCNCISPGPFPNPTVQKNHPEFVQRLAGNSPMGRIGSSKEIAGSVAFLLSDASSYVTAHNLVVDGGWTSW